MSSYTRNQLEEWVKNIDVKADRVLDIGGSQLPIKGRTKSWDVKDYKILDLEQPHECKVKPDIITDLNDIITDKTFDNYFDVAFCLEVMEYMWMPGIALNNIKHLLKKGGILYISFHFIYPMHNPNGKDYLRYTRWGVEKLLKETGFEIDRDFSKSRLAIDFRGLMGWFRSEKMRPSNDYYLHNEVGYLVKAIKK